MSQRGIWDSSLITKNRQTRAVFSNALVQRTAVDARQRPFMVLQSGTVGQGGPINDTAIADTTGSIVLTRAEFNQASTPVSSGGIPDNFFRAPTYDLANTTYDSASKSITIAWNAVPGVTHYKVMVREIPSGTILASDKLQNDANNRLSFGSKYTPFTFESGLLTATSYVYTLNEQTCFFVFSYTNGIRGRIPITQLFVAPEKAEIWQTIESVRTSSMITSTNLCTGRSVTQALPYDSVAWPTDVIQNSQTLLDSKNF